MVIKKGRHVTQQTWWRAERQSVFEAPLSGEDPWTVSVTQKGPCRAIRLVNTTKVVHLHKEVLLIEHLQRRERER